MNTPQIKSPEEFFDCSRAYVHISLAIQAVKDYAAQETAEMGKEVKSLNELYQLSLKTSAVLRDQRNEALDKVEDISKELDQALVLLAKAEDLIDIKEFCIEIQAFITSCKKTH